MPTLMPPSPPRGLRYSHIFAGILPVAQFCPLRPLAGEKEGTRRVSDGEGEVGVAGTRSGRSPTSPRPSPPPEDVSDGFLDKTEVTCPATSDSVNGVDTAARGYCIVTDKDGDKAFLVWQGKGTGAGSADAGTFQWTGGTGKFAGLQGNNTFGHGIFPISKTSGGWTVWEGDWRLP